MRCALTPVLTVTLAMGVACGPRADRTVDAGQLDPIVVSPPPESRAENLSEMRSRQPSPPTSGQTTEGEIPVEGGEDPFPLPGHRIDAQPGTSPWS